MSVSIVLRGKGDAKRYPMRSLPAVRKVISKIVGSTLPMLSEARGNLVVEPPAGLTPTQQGRNTLILCFYEDVRKITQLVSNGNGSSLIEMVSRHLAPSSDRQHSSMTIGHTSMSRLWINSRNPTKSTMPPSTAPASFSSCTLPPCWC